MKTVQRKSKSTETSRRFLAPVVSHVRRHGTARLVTAYNKLSGEKITKTVIYRWLMNKGNPVEPRLGAGLMLKRAWIAIRRAK